MKREAAFAELRKTAARYVKRAHHHDRCSVRYPRQECNCGKWDLEDALRALDALDEKEKSRDL